MTDLDLTSPQADLAANAIRFLAIDAVEKANSGHPGMPMGMADIAVALWGRHLVVDPDDPEWPDRDRFVVSNGHGSMLLYAVLHLAGFKLDIEDIVGFRQLGSPTPGHPEIERHLGIETTTGPLGQGFGTAVGMALAEERLRAVFGAELVDHTTYAFVSDGDLMEGVSSEAASLAGHLELGRLVYLYDDNRISLEGPTEWTFSEDVPKRFEAYGWHTETVDGHDRIAVDEAISAARAESGRPSLISCKTHIGYGSPNKQDTASAHGSPLGADEVAMTREALGWELPPFEVPDEARAFFEEAMQRGRAARNGWMERRHAAFSADPELAARWVAFHEPPPVRLDAPTYDAGKSVATRAMSGDVIQQLAELRPDFVSGDADLAGSTKSLIEGARRLLRRRPDRAQHPLRGAGARHGHDRQRVEPPWRGPRLRVHLPDLLRLHARRGTAVGVDGVPEHLGVEPRLGVPRRGRSHPPAHRASRRSAAPSPGCG